MNQLKYTFFLHLAPKHVIATDGEVRKEYEEELKKVCGCVSLKIKTVCIVPSSTENSTLNFKIFS